MNSNPEGAADQSNDRIIDNPHEINKTIATLVDNMPGLSENQKRFIGRKAIEQLQPKNLKKNDILNWECTTQDIIDAVRESAKLLQVEGDTSDPIMTIRMPMRKITLDVAKNAAREDDKEDEDLPAAG